MKLEDVIPEKPEFTLSATGKTYVLRIPNLEDRAWVRKRFDTETINQAFRTRDWGVIAQILFRLIEDKSDFTPREIDDYDDDGEVYKRRLTGPNVLCRMISKSDDEEGLLGAWCSAIAASNPAFRAHIEDEVKKSLQLLSRLKTQTTGPKSSTESLTNTDGPSTTSKPEHLERSTSQSEQLIDANTSNSDSSAQREA